MSRKLKGKVFVLSLISVMICSACMSEEVVSSSVTTTAPPASTTSEAVTSTSSAATETTTTATTLRTEETTEAVTTTTSATTTESTSAEEITTTSSETTAFATTVTTTAVETSASVTETQTEILTETSVPAAEKPPAVIMAREVSSPGKLVEKTETAAIDYSNASLGYISALYSGKSARAKLRIVCNGVTCDHDLSVTGEAEYFPLMQGSGDYRIQIYEQLDGKLYSAALDLSVTLSIEDDVEMYLYPNRYSMFTEKSKCVKTSAELCAGLDGEIEKIAAIFKYITDNVTYDYDLAATVQSGYIPNPDSVFEKNTGICFDYASLFAAMARSQGIPARLVIGYAEPEIYHAWNEVYTKETGWITPELLLSQKGYNLVDATFYAGAKDKNSIAEYISDEGNYSSLYRY
ncbi:MAG: transglutaminase domain-containing protein [Ruminiclostridium sp.]|nr:transglutaminase domain-containing protein [Ruminiclostridium sp.]